MTEELPEWKRKEREIRDRAKSAFKPRVIKSFPEGDIVQDADGKMYAVTTRGVRKKLGF